MTPEAGTGPATSFDRRNIGLTTFAICKVEQYKAVKTLDRLTLLYCLYEPQDIIP
jgi:hypothetical protein